MRSLFPALDYFQDGKKVAKIPNNTVAFGKDLVKRERERERTFRKYNVPGTTLAPLPFVVVERKQRKRALKKRSHLTNPARTRTLFRQLSPRVRFISLPRGQPLEQCYFGRQGLQLGVVFLLAQTFPPDAGGRGGGCSTEELHYPVHFHTKCTCCMLCFASPFVCLRTGA